MQYHVYKSAEFELIASFERLHWQQIKYSMPGISSGKITITSISAEVSQITTIFFSIFAFFWRNYDWNSEALEAANSSPVIAVIAGKMCFGHCQNKSVSRR